MGNIQFYGDEILFTSDGKIAMHEDCCCEEGLCNIDTSDDIYVEFGTGSDCSDCGFVQPCYCFDCIGCSTNIFGKKFKLSWNETDGRWEYESSASGGVCAGNDYLKIWVLRSCNGGAFVTVHAFVQNASTGRAYCFFANLQDIEGKKFPIVVSDEQGDCLTYVIVPIGVVCGTGATATITKAS